MMAILNKNIIIIILTILLQGCSYFEGFDRVARVGELNVELSPRSKVINEGRNLVLEGKQSLKIALLKIKFLVFGVDYSKNSVVVLSRDIFFGANLNRDDASRQQKRNLQKALLPELFQIYSVLEDLKMTLVVTCRSQLLCTSEQLRQWVPSNISVIGIYPKNEYKLAKYKPVLILSNSRELLFKVQKVHPRTDLTYWASKWIKLPQFSKVSLSFNEWNSLVPSVTNF